MLLDLLTYGFNKWILIYLLLSLPVILFSLSFHETAHGLIAKKLGDPTASSLGRLSLNPLKHIDPIGFLCMLTVGFGWAKPVPINTRYFKNPRKDMAKVGIAGPLSNLLLALISYILMSLLFAATGKATGYNLSIIFSALNGGFDASEIPGGIIALWLLYMFMEISVTINLTLAIFNLIPVPPFDGSRFFYAILPTKWYFGVMKYERYIGLGLIFLIFALSRLGIYPISALTDLIEQGLYVIIGKPIIRLFGLVTVY